MLIDAHHHLWDPAERLQDWIDAQVPLAIRD